MSAASFPPKWVMLERFVFRMDDEKRFPDETKLPIRASGTTWWGAPFHVAFEVAEPPAISRLHARLPGFPDPRKQVPLAILASHRHLVLLRVCIQVETCALQQELFIFDSDALGADDDACKLKALPACTLPDMPSFMDYPIRGGRRRRRRRFQPPPPLNKEQRRRLMAVRSMGILCGDQQEFVVAELLICIDGPPVCADIFWLHKLDVSSSSGAINGKWNSCRVPIRSFCKNTKGIHSCSCKNKKNLEGIHSYCCKNPSIDDTWQLRIWQTDAVIPVDRWLCWVDYYRGILFCDVFGDPNPTVSFLRLPLDEFPSSPVRGKPSSWLYRGASDVGGRKLKFVDVARHDGFGYGALRTSAGGFTITCHTLSLDTMEWDKDCTITSEELWLRNAPKDLPRHILMFPQVDIYRPHIVHFLCCDYEYVVMKMWVVSINMSTRIVESCSQYLNGFADLKTDKVELAQKKSTCPLSFLPSEFSKFLHLKSGGPCAPARARATVLTRAFVATPSVSSFKTRDAAPSAASFKTQSLMDTFKTHIAAPSAASFKTRGLMDAL